jgi:beta-galactosidase
VVVRRVESLRPGLTEPARVGSERFECAHWLEHVESPLAPMLASDAGHGLWYRHGRLSYLACWPSGVLLRHVLRELCAEAGVAVVYLPEGLRIVRRGDLHFAFNYDGVPATVPGGGREEFVLGSPVVAPGGVSAWRV